MSNRTNPNYLKNYQYYDSQNLNARINLHRRFSTNNQDWFRWVFDQFALPTPAQILELGCGSGLLWKMNLDRIPIGYQVFLSDFSPGMIFQARLNIGTASGAFCYSVLDAQSVPYSAVCFDLVIANHMLYHIPNRSLALNEIHRVLKPGGKMGVSDSVTSGELREKIKNDLAAWAGCVAGAVDIDMYTHAIENAGLQDVVVKPVFFGPEMMREAESHIDLKDLAGIPPEKLQSAIFSAKITAHKP